MATMKCLEITAEASLNMPNHLSSDIHKPPHSRRQGNHPPLLIFYTDLVVWVWLVFVCVCACACACVCVLSIATLWPLMRQWWPMGSKAHNPIWVLYQQIYWDGLRLGAFFLAKETVQVFLPAFCMSYSCYLRKHWQDHLQDWKLFLGQKWFPKQPCLGLALLVGNVVPDLFGPHRRNKVGISCFNRKWECLASPCLKYEKVPRITLRNLQFPLSHKTRSLKVSP